MTRDEAVLADAREILRSVREPYTEADLLQALNASVARARAAAKTDYWCTGFCRCKEAGEILFDDCWERE